MIAQPSELHAKYGPDADSLPQPDRGRRLSLLFRGDTQMFALEILDRGATAVRLLRRLALLLQSNHHLNDGRGAWAAFRLGRRLGHIQDSLSGG